jgi:hypothetical protein
VVIDADLNINVGGKFDSWITETSDKCLILKWKQALQEVGQCSAEVDVISHVLY